MADLKKILITGGAGFFGLHLARQIGNNSDSIICFDKESADPSEYPSNATFIKADIKDQKAVMSAAEGCDVIVHAAAALPLEPKKNIYETNLNGTRNALEAAIQNNVKRFILISSTAVYGVPEKFPITESDPLIPVGPYAETKIESEKMCEQFRDKGLVSTIIRPKTFIGTHRLGVFQILYDWVQDGVKIPMIGNGKNRYQLLEVQDLCSAVRYFFDAQEDVANDVYNVGGKEFGTVREDLTALCEHAGSGSKPFGTPAAPTVLLLRILEAMRLSPLYKWVYGTASKNSMVSIDKILNRTSWKPEFSNSEALIHAYDWYMKNLESISNVSGTTHRVPWKQGALSVAKKFLQ